MRSLSPVQAAAFVALVGAVLACAIPPFVRNLHASRLVEPIDGLNQIAKRATALAAVQPAERAYPETTGLTPKVVPRGERTADPPGTWDHPTWVKLQFAWTVPHSFSFAFESEKEQGKSKFRARAHGDLDADGVLSTFEISGAARDGAEPEVFPMSIYREVE